MKKEKKAKEKKNNQPNNKKTQLHFPTPKET